MTNSLKIHACTDCKWILRGSGGVPYDVCEVTTDEHYFDFTDGSMNRIKRIIRMDDNGQGHCEYFKPSMWAMFLRFLGRKYEHEPSAEGKP